MFDRLRSWAAKRVQSRRIRRRVFRCSVLFGDQDRKPHPLILRPGVIRAVEEFGQQWLVSTDPSDGSRLMAEKHHPSGNSTAVEISLRHAGQVELNARSITALRMIAYALRASQLKQVETRKVEAADA